MSLLAQLQDALGAILTEGEVEEVYLRDPDEALAAVADPEARGTLSQLAAADILRYARRLRRKRWDEVAEQVPLSVRAIADLEDRYQTWLSAHPPTARHTVVPPGAAEALRALVDLSKDLSTSPHDPPWTAELLVFEVLSACSRADGVPRGLQAQYPIHEIVETLRAGLLPHEPPLEPHAYAFGVDGARMKRLG